MLSSSIQLWSLSTPGENNLGLCCTEEGLFLGGTSLIERHAGRYAVRSRAELGRLFKRISGGPHLDRALPGLAVVKSALDDNNLCLAQIAAVRLWVPDLPDFFAPRTSRKRRPAAQSRARRRHPGARWLGRGRAPARRSARPIRLVCADRRSQLDERKSDSTRARKSVL